MKYYPFILIVVSVVARLIPAINTPIVGDLTHWWKVGETVLQGKNPYVGDGPLYPYPPIWMWVEAGAVWLSKAFSLPFGVVIKTPLILSDAVTAVFIYLLSIKNVNRGFFLGLIYALNPVSILITAFHGQFDTLPLLMILLSIFFLQRKKIKFSALFLGFGIAIKSFPILLLPFFLIYIKKSTGKIIYAFLSLLPVILLLLPYFVLNFDEVYKSLLSYSGWTDQGWMAAIRAIYWLKNSTVYTSTPILNDLLVPNKILFLLLYMLVIKQFFKEKKVRSILLFIITIFALFYFVYGGISSQYLLWILPFIILLDIHLAFWYTLFATFALLGYYTFFLPRLILWLFPFFPLSIYTEKMLKVTILGNNGQLSVDTPMVSLIRLALTMHLFTTLVFWLFLGYILFKKLLPSLFRIK